MARVTVTGTFRFRCQTVPGTFDYQEVAYSFVSDDSEGGDNYAQAAFDSAYIAGQVPPTCDQYGWTLESVTPAPGEQGQPVTVYILAWCVDAQGVMIDREYTLAFETTTGADVSDIIQQASETANFWYENSQGPSACREGNAVGARWRIVAPLIYQYSMGD